MIIELQAEGEISPKDLMSEINSAQLSLFGDEGAAKNRLKMIAFNGRYVMDCLGAMDSDDVAMEFASLSRPVKITGDSGFVYVLMPMALK